MHAPRLVGRELNDGDAAVPADERLHEVRLRDRDRLRVRVRVRVRVPPFQRSSVCHA